MCTGMARGLIVSPQTKPTSHLMMTMLSSSISRGASVSLHKPTKRLKNQFASSFSSTHLLFSLYNPFYTRRFLCNCSSYHQHGSIDMGTYREAFAKRMAMAGLKPHHPIAMGVSGGPDSMALCVLAASWKRDGLNIASERSSEFIDGLLAIVVDHRLRAESKDEADSVCSRVTDMGIRCEIAHCEWWDGRPKLGHLQEAARDMRYQILQTVCAQHEIGVLLIAHHADDQAELFILRLSRGSGVLGLAGMAFTSQLFTKCLYFDGEASNGHGILLVRPLLEYSKVDMYKICQGGHQECVEDPTNRSPLFARNRIRMSLENLPSSTFKSELQAVISACRRTRVHVDQLCRRLLNQAVTIMPQGYAVINLEILDPSKVTDLCLSKFVTLVLQFISQKHKPVRGSTSKLLLDYIRTFPCKRNGEKDTRRVVRGGGCFPSGSSSEYCVRILYAFHSDGKLETSFAAAGCYLCPSPGSKGARILVCCSVDSSVSSKLDLFHKHSGGGPNCLIPSDVEQIAAEGKSYADQLVPETSDVHFLNSTSSESVLIEAKRLGILNESTHSSIVLLQSDEIKHFRSKSDVVPNFELKNVVEAVNTSPSQALYPGQIGYFMNRFLVSWKLSKKTSCNTHSVDMADCDLDLKVESQQYYSRSGVVGHAVVAEVQVRHMIDPDWLYLAELSKFQHAENSQQGVLLATRTVQGICKINLCSNYVKLSAQNALLCLKSIPVAARRSLPVLVNLQGLILSIPSIGFKNCPCLNVCTEFKPRIPLGGGHSSFI